MEDEIIDVEFDSGDDQYALESASYQVSIR